MACSPRAGTASCYASRPFTHEGLNAAAAMWGWGLVGRAHPDSVRRTTSSRQLAARTATEAQAARTQALEACRRADRGEADTPMRGAACQICITPGGNGAGEPGKQADDGARTRELSRSGAGAMSAPNCNFGSGSKLQAFRLRTQYGPLAPSFAVCRLAVWRSLLQTCCQGW